MKQIFSIFVLLFLAFNTIDALNSVENTKKIDYVNLLLPVIYDQVDSRNIQFTLNGYNGCYEWYTSHPKLIRVDNIPDDGRCNSRAVISVITTQSDGNIIWIFARDKGNFLLLIV